MTDPRFGLARLRKIDTSNVGPFVRQRNKPRGIPPALGAHPVFSVDNPESAQRLAEWLFGKFRLHPAHPESFMAALHAVKIRDVTLAHIEFSCPTDIISEGWNPNPTLVVPSAGSSTLVHREHAIDLTPITAAIPLPGSVPILRCYGQSAHVVVQFDRGALFRYLARQLGRSVDEELLFELTFDLSNSRASRWNLALQAIYGELLDEDSLLHAGEGVAELEEFLMGSLLMGAGNTYSTELGSDGRPSNRVVRAARRYIEENLRTELSIREIAEASGVSDRTLQSLFRKELGTTPMSYVRERRLERVRGELADADVENPPTVSAVASHWGFHHFGRFSSAYRQRFGETPSETLRQ